MENNKISTETLESQIWKFRHLLSDCDMVPAFDMKLAINEHGQKIAIFKDDSGEVIDTVSIPDFLPKFF